MKKKFKFNPKENPDTPPPPPINTPPSNEGQKLFEESLKSMGFGDTVAKAIKKATFGKVKECEPCRKRKEALNKIFPYKNKDNNND